MRKSRLDTILICDDDVLVRQAIKLALKNRFEVIAASNADEALALLRARSVDALLLDVQMRTPDEGLRFLPAFRGMDDDLAIIMLSGLTDFATVREAMRLGANDYLPKDFQPDELLLTLERSLERRRLVRRQGQLEFEARSGKGAQELIGASAAMAELRKTLAKLKLSPANVLITGETGTGKEVVARNLRGTRPDGTLAPFIAVDSSTIQSSTAESQLFGHEKGAFTGADSTRKGIFEEADGGTVYFDEIANMPLDIQAKLLRVLQEKEITRMGSSRVIPLEFRVVCATNRDLEKLVAEGRFKDDLLQRLNVLPVHLQPLRERTDDIPELVSHFAARYTGGASDGVKFTEEAIRALRNYPWPGNVRELANVVTYVLAMTEGSEVDVSDLPPRIRDAARPGRGAAPGIVATAGAAAAAPTDFYGRVSAFEREILADALSRSDGNMSRLALQLGMDRSHLYSKLREFKLK